jgi:hypothetical protein
LDILALAGSNERKDPTPPLKFLEYFLAFPTSDREITNFKGVVKVYAHDLFEAADDGLITVSSAMAVGCRKPAGFEFRVVKDYSHLGDAGSTVRHLEVLKYARDFINKLAGFGGDSSKRLAPHDID